MTGRADASAVKKRLSETRKRLPEALRAVSAEGAARMEQEARAAAPWQDRTGEARRGLTGLCEEGGTAFHVGVESRVAYAAQLEYGNEGAHAVVLPTVRRLAPEVLASAADAVRRGG